MEANPQTAALLTEKPVDVADYRELFARLVVRHMLPGARLLEIGAGSRMLPQIREIRRAAAHICGVDPSKEILSNPDLDEKHVSRLEDLDLDGRLYDGAYALNVVEHIKEPAAFLKRTADALKPGAWFWAVTPNARHPFAWLSRSVEVVGLKRLARRLHTSDDGAPYINDYPSYYRLGHASRLLVWAKDAGFDAAELYYPTAGWEGYFPRWLRWVPNSYDRFISQKHYRHRLILIFGLRRGA